VKNVTTKFDLKQLGERTDLAQLSEMPSVRIAVPPSSIVVGRDCIGPGKYAITGKQLSNAFK
jgi:hypothetical protein